MTDMIAEDLCIMLVLDADLKESIQRVVNSINGIQKLYEGQRNLLRHLVNGENLFFTSPTNSGKTLPPVLLPSILNELGKLGYGHFPETPRVLFVTALNSIQSSLVSNMETLGIKCAALSYTNVNEVLISGVSILFVGPEVLKHPTVTASLLKYRSSFVCKVIDEAHLGKN